MQGATYHNDTVKRYYFYNSAGDLVRDSTLSFSWGYYFTTTKNEYSYNSAGNISQVKYFVQSFPNWYENNRYELSYYNNQQLKKITMYYVPYGYNYRVDTFGWTSGVDYYTYHQSYNVSNDTTVINRHLETKIVSPTSMLPDSVIHLDYSFGSYPDTTILKYKFEYDSYGMPVKRDNYEYNPAYVTADSLISTVYYHYKPNTTDIFEVGVSDGHLSIFPNPTAGVFTLQLPEQNGYENLFIYDIAGKLILNKSIRNRSETTIDLTNQPPGNYIIKVTSGDRIFRDRVVIR